MDNRFSFKDLVISALLIALIASVWLGMKQFDRQWEIVRTINQKLDDQTRELAHIRRVLGHATSRSTSAAPKMRVPPKPVESAQVSQPPTGPVAPAVPVKSTTLPKTTATQQVQRNQLPNQPRTAPLKESIEDVKPPSPTYDPFARINAARAQTGYSEGDWIVDAFSGGVAKLTPLLSGDVYASMIQDLVIDTLASRDPATLEWIGLLADSWQISDDGLMITFQLRRDATFSDGQPLDADDVVFTFDFIMNEKIAAPRHRAYLNTIERVEKLGSYEVIFRYREPYFEAFELAASLPILPQHFYSKFKPEVFNQSVGLLLGSGPYRLPDPTNWKPGKTIQLVRNDRYWGVPPATDRLIFKEITNDVARLTAFRNGDIDLFAAQPEQYRAMIGDENLAKRSMHYDYLSPTGGYRYLAWNQKRNGSLTRFADKRVRQAMTMLTDRPRMIQQIMLGYAIQATGPFNPQGKQTAPSVDPWPYDVTQGKELLAQAGYQDRDGDGVLESTDGTPFAFKLNYPSGNTNYEKMVLFLKDTYAKAGIVLEPDPLEWAVFTDRLKNKDYEAITLGWSGGIETDIYQMFHSSQLIEGGDNFVSYQNPQLDALIDQARHTIDENQRMLLWHQCHEILHEDQPYTFLSFSKSLRFIDHRFRNIEKLKLGLNPRTEWWVPSAQQRWNQ